MDNHRILDYRIERMVRNQGPVDFWQTVPTCTVLIIYVPAHITEQYLYRWFYDRKIKIRGVQIETRETGSKRQLSAIVEFYTVQESVDWMNKQQGMMMITDGHISGLLYSRKAVYSQSINWTCSNDKCSFINYSYSTKCYRCATPKPSNSLAESDNSYFNENDDGASQVGSNPCNTIIIRGLDRLTTKQSLLEALALVTSLRPKNCGVVRNVFTGVSFGYAFIEFDSVVSAKQVRDYFINNQPFQLMLANMQPQGIHQQLQPDQYKSQTYRQPTEYELQAVRANQMSATMQVATPTAANGYANLPQYPEPDTSQYQWDANSGYYYDPSTGPYYDAQSQYYYNMTTQEYMYWGGTARTHIPVKGDSQQAETPKNLITEKPEKDGKNKDKSVAKEVVRWATSQDMQSVIASADSNSLSKQASADMAYDVLIGNKRLASTANKNTDLMPPPPMAAGVKRPAPASGLVASYEGDDSDNDDEQMDEASHIDKQKLTCNLCERKFNSTAILEKHVQMSDLHKENLAKLKQKSQGQLTKQYIDRLKGRRLKSGGTTGI